MTDPAQQRYLRLIDNLVAGVWELDAASLTTFVNDTTARMLGYRPGEMIGRPLDDFIWDADKVEQARHMRERSRGVHEIFERRYRRADGSPCWCLVSATSLADGEGRYAGSFAILADISDRKRVEEELRGTTRLLDSIRSAQLRYIAGAPPRAVFETLLDTLVEVTGSECGFLSELRREEGGAAYLVDVALSNVAWNQASRADFEDRHCGARRPRGLRGLVGQTVVSGTPVIANDVPADSRFRGTPPGHPALRTFMALPLFHGGELIGVAGVANRAGGYERALPARLEPLLLTCAGILQGCRAAERERAQERALEESERTFREFADVVREAFWVRDMVSDRVVYLSPGYETIWGRPCSEVAGTDGWVLDNIHPDDEAKLRAARDESRAHGVAFDQECRIVRTDGSIRWIEVHVYPIHDGEGRVVRMAGIVEDITERKHAEQERLDMERQLLHMQKLESLGVLAGGIAHDFNNLLAAVLGNLEMALEDLPPDAPVRPSVGEALRASKRAVELTRQMLAYSGRGRFVTRLLSLRALVEENAQLFRASVARSVSLELDLPDDLPPILADPGQMQQLVVNLITNASEAIGEGAGTVRVRMGVEHCDEETLRASRVEARPAAGEFVFIEVIDDGGGMDDETQRRLFDPFFTTKFMGRGLGMAAVLGIVRGHKGAIFVSSRPGQGSRVKVLFPSASPRGRSAADAAAARPAPVGTDDQRPPSGVVLLADDDPAVLAIERRVLERLGYSVLTAADGEEAVEIFRSRPDEIRCVVLDLTMPRMDGVAALKAIRAVRPDVPILVASGFGEEATSERFRSGDRFAFIPKPFRLETVRMALSSLFQSARQP